MKRKILFISLLTMIIAFSFASCDIVKDVIDRLENSGIGSNLDDETAHIHDFSQRNTSSLYVMSSANCTEPAVYYFSCSCGEIGSETFTDGDARGHAWKFSGCNDPLYCSVCHVKDDKVAGHVWYSWGDDAKKCDSCGVIHKHLWIDAGCMRPRTCAICDEIRGEALGHRFSAATCVTPKTCQNCSRIEGEALGHTFSAATCTMPRICEACGYADGEALGHVISDGICSRCEKKFDGLTTSTAYEIENVNRMPANSGELVASATVTYFEVVIPKGYLYEFIPTKSGVYRITSKSDKKVEGWVFTGTSEEWVESGSRSVLTDSSSLERYSPDLFIDSDGDGIYEYDSINISLVAYMEAYKKYYIDIAYYDVYEVGTFTFDIKWVGEGLKQFVQASPGPITYIEDDNGGIGKHIAGGIDVDFKYDGDIEYAYHVIERDADGNVTKWGDKIYADFTEPTTLFPGQSIVELIDTGKFDFTDKMPRYLEDIEKDPTSSPARKGCIAVTRELAEILDTLIARDVFEGVENGWLKFCYYYKTLGYYPKM